MRLGIISTVGGYTWAGSEELWHRMALLALQRGVKIEAMISEDMITSRQIKTLIDAGGVVRSRQKNIHPRVAALKEKVLRSYESFIAKKDVVLVSLGSLLDVVFLPGLLPALLNSKRPFILLCQFNSDLLQFSPAHRSSISKLFELSASQVFVSRDNLAHAQRQLAGNFSNAHVVYNPIKVLMDKPYDMPGSPVIQFGCVARFETLWKGHDILLETLASMEWRTRSWHLNLYGTGPDKPYIDDLIKYFALTDKVTIHGQVDDIGLVWKQNHIKLLASRGEGTPLAILEAMMCGRPVVTTDVGGNREIIEEGRNGWIADAATCYSFGRALNSAWELRHDWTSAGRRGHEKARALAAEDPGKQLLEIITASAT